MKTHEQGAFSRCLFVLVWDLFFGRGAAAHYKSIIKLQFYLPFFNLLSFGDLQLLNPVKCSLSCTNFELFGGAVLWEVCDERSFLSVTVCPKTTSDHVLSSWIFKLFISNPKQADLMPPLCFWYKSKHCSLIAWLADETLLRAPLFWLVSHLVGSENWIHWSSSFRPTSFFFFFFFRESPAIRDGGWGTQQEPSGGLSRQK